MKAPIVVAVDCSCIRENGKGVDRMGRNFVRMLETAPSRWSFVLLGIGSPAWRNVPVAGNAQVALHPRRVSRTSWYRLVLPHMLQRIRPRLVHGLADFLPRSRAWATVLTVTEDPARRLAVADSRSPFARARAVELTRSFEASLRRSEQVIAISHTVARDLASRYSYPGARLRVAHLGIEPMMLAAPVRDPRLGRYFLTFRSGDRRERWPLVMQAFELARRGEPDLRLVVVGSAATQTGSRGVVYRGRVPDGELANLFRHAIALVDVASFEGFGLQILEACHFGTPIIAADLPTVREVVGDTALTHPSPTPDWIAIAMRRVAEHRGRFLPIARVDSGWDAFAHQSWDAYDDALSSQATRSAHSRMWAWRRNSS